MADIHRFGRPRLSRGVQQESGTYQFGRLQEQPAFSRKQLALSPEVKHYRAHATKYSPGQMLQQLSPQPHHA